MALLSWNCRGLAQTAEISSSCISSHYNRFRLYQNLTELGLVTSALQSALVVEHGLEYVEVRYFFIANVARALHVACLQP